MKFRLFLLVFLVSCSGSGTKERHALRELVKVGNYQEAVDFLDSIDQYQDQNSKILYFMERGLLEFRMGFYENAARVFEKAIELNESLSYVSIKDGATSTLVNETKRKYRGEIFERGMLHFYKAYSYLMLSHSGKTFSSREGEKKEILLSPSDKRNFLIKARSEVVAWNSYLEKVRQNRLGKSIFKYDLLQHIFGGFIHEQMKTSGDRQIALLLYKKALDVLYKNYNVYGIYNSRFKRFIKDFSKLSNLSKTVVEKKYIVETKFQKSLKDFLIFKILSLSKASGRSTFKKAVSTYRPTKNILSLVNKTVRSNVIVTHFDSIIGEKIPKTEYYSLERALGGNSSDKDKRAVARFGASAITLFAGAKLGLLPPPSHYSPVGAEMGVRLGLAASRGVAISFQVPKIRKIKKPNENKSLLITNTENGKVKRLPFPVVAPLTDIAEQAVRENAIDRVIRQGTRLAWKHITAIVTCMATYDSMKKNSSPFVAKQAALFQYMALVEVIKETEKADTRFWSTLPNLIRMSHLELPKGHYTLSVEGSGFSKNFSIKNKNDKVILNL